MMCSGLMVWLVEEFVISFPPSVNSLLLAGINAAPHVCFWHIADRPCVQVKCTGHVYMTFLPKAVMDT